MAEESKQAQVVKEEVVITHVAESISSPTVVEKASTEHEHVPEPEKVAEEVVEGGDNKVTESASFKEESNVVADLPNPQQKALDEFKELVKSALEKHEFTAPPPPPEPVKEVVEEVKEHETEGPVEVPDFKEEDKKEPECAPVEVPEVVKEEPPKAEAEKVEEKPTPPPAEVEKVVVGEKTEEKVEVVEDIKETIVEVTTPPPPPAAEATEKEKPNEEKPEPMPETEATPPPPPPPEEVSIWGVKLLVDDSSDAILLKFLRARDFKVKEAFTMLKNVVQWRKEFGVDTLIEEETSSEGLDKVVYLHGIDKEGHLVLYNSFGEFQDKELYQNTFADAEKRTRFLRGIIQFFEKTIRNLDFTPDGICTLFQVIDLKNSPGLFFFKKDLRQAISQALELFQDNYPEFVAKQVYINVPWWFRAYYSMINVIFSPRTKSKFVFAGPSRSAGILFKYIAPEKVPVRYGGLSKEGESEFTNDDATTEVVLKPTSKHTIEFEVTEKCTLAWELRVVGWEVSYGAEFVPSAEGGYTVIVQKPRKVGPMDEPIITSSYTSGEAGKVVLTINNQTSKRKNLAYRSKNKHSD
ncbi:hypothetical protein LIER_34313 [Lithospermum erythrorhizon]|uniref:Uncharacterized protein n=1 Tax=Lithospermum erythrorhizon TaxID=34254 RepID=A0AAV3S2A0_LITER